MTDRDATRAQSEPAPDTEMGQAPIAALERLFHEPNRLAIVSSLCGALEGATFMSLKEECGLTDGNLSRHLEKLEREGVVRIEKAFVGPRPRTTVFLTDAGREKFVTYLQALEAVLRKAAQALVAPAERAVAPKRGVRGVQPNLGL